MSRFSTEDLKELAKQVRRDVVRMVHQAGSGHPGGSLGCADLLVALYFRVMKHNSRFSLEGEGEDIFYLSNGHISPLWYSVLARSGYFPLSELKTFRQINSRLQGHPGTLEGLPGIRVASGSLGQGLSVAIGTAQAKKLKKDPQHVYVLMGDGEQQEGQIWEAAMYAAHHKVDNLLAIVDYNGQQIDGHVKEVMSLGSLKKKYEAFGWQVMEVDGNHMGSLLKTLENAKDLMGKKEPVFLLMHTKMGCGVDFMENNYRWHGIAPNKEQFDRAIAQLPITPHGDY
ncbi:MAG: transketolase [Cytophagales bacterium]|nr:transketolase [Cytophagales bacterium]